MKVECDKLFVGPSNWHPRKVYVGLTSASVGEFRAWKEIDVAEAKSIHAYLGVFLASNADEADVP